MNLRVCYLCGSIQGVKKYLSTDGSTYHYCPPCAEKEAGAGRLLESPKAYLNNEATKHKGPTDWEREPVPRKAYVELMKSCKRLNELRLAKKERVQVTRLFCYSCNELIEDDNVAAQKPQCKSCREKNAFEAAVNRAQKEKRKRAKAKRSK